MSLVLVLCASLSFAQDAVVTLPDGAPALALALDAVDPDGGWAGARAKADILVDFKDDTQATATLVSGRGTVTAVVSVAYDAVPWAISDDARYEVFVLDDVTTDEGCVGATLDVTLGTVAASAYKPRDLSFDDLVVAPGYVVVDIKTGDVDVVIPLANHGIDPDEIDVAGDTAAAEYDALGRLAGGTAASETDGIDPDEIDVAGDTAAAEYDALGRLAGGAAASETDGIDPDEIDYDSAVEGIDPDEIDYDSAVEGIDPDEIDVSVTGIDPDEID